MGARPGLGAVADRRVCVILLEQGRLDPSRENGFVDSFNGTFRAEILNREFFDTLLEAKGQIERWRHEYSTVRPHGSLGYRPPAPEAVQPKSAAGVR